MNYICYPFNFKIMAKKPLVIGIGELLWDVFPDHKQMGGAPCNFAYHATKLGLDSMAISAIGNDELGTEIINKLDAVGLKYDMQHVDKDTGTVNTLVIYFIDKLIYSYNGRIS